MLKTEFLHIPEGVVPLFETDPVKAGTFHAACGHFCRRAVVKCCACREFPACQICCVRTE